MLTIMIRVVSTRRSMKMSNPIYLISLYQIERSILTKPYSCRGMELTNPTSLLSLSSQFPSLFFASSFSILFPNHHSIYKTLQAFYSSNSEPNQMSSRPQRGGCCASCCSFLFSLGCMVFVYWLIFQPHQIRAYLDSATLSRFSLSNATSAPSLSYNISLTLSIRNPNRRIGIYCDRLSAAAFYNGSQLGPTETNFDPFFQHTKTTQVVHPAFEGDEGNLGEGVREAFNKEKSDGAYNVEVKLNAKLRYKVWFIKVHGFKPKIDCWLRFPVMANGSASMADPAPTKCHVKY